MNSLVFNLLMALLFGGIITSTYYFTHQKRTDIEMLLTILILPLVITMIIYTIGSNVAGAFSLAGIFSIVRFRSTQASFKDIIYILFCVAAGLAAATSFYLEGTLFTIVASIILIIFSMYTNKNKQARLVITIAEDLQNEKAIDQILNKYTKTYFIDSVKTRDLGSLYEYSYQVFISQRIDIKDLIDELRVVNSNLPIKIVL